MKVNFKSSEIRIKFKEQIDKEFGTKQFTKDEAKASAEMHEESERLRPVIVDTKRGVGQLQRIFEALARLDAFFAC